MGLNVSKGNMYGFISHTFNMVKGHCFHDCAYCYMKRWGKLNPPRFDNKELKTNLLKNNCIFVGSSCDMFNKNIPNQWIESTINHCKRFDNTYFFQSKNPLRFKDFDLPNKSIVCSTIETNRFYPEIMGNAPLPSIRAEDLKSIPHKKHITIEPIIDFDMEEFLNILISVKPVQINIGADSKNSNLPEPEIHKIELLIENLKSHCKIHIKPNLKRLIKIN